MLLMFIINSLVGSWDIYYLSWNSAERFAKTVHIDANFKIHSWTWDDL